MNNIEFYMSMASAKHFGSNLYTTNPPAIAELIANSWDAYAKNVNLYIYKNNDTFSLTLQDDGIGMNIDTIRNKYAVSGRKINKNDIEIPNGMCERPYMGRKGIGKFAAFSLGECYTLYSKDSTSEKWIKITLSENILNDGDKVYLEYEELETLDDDISLKVNYNSGTIIHIPKLRNKFTKSSFDNFEDLIRRRFSIKGEQNIFNLTVDKDSEIVNIDFDKNFYYEKVQFLTQVGHEKSLEDLKKTFSRVDSNNSILEFTNPEVTKYFKDNNISGWIGTVLSPSDLKNLSGVTVYINNKLADENIFRNKRNSVAANSYLIGEINADFLQDDINDPVLSSREGLDLEVEKVRELQDNLDKVRKHLISNWNELRTKANNDTKEYFQELKDQNDLYTIYDSLDEKKKFQIEKNLQMFFDNKKISHPADKRMIFSLSIQMVNNLTIKKIESDNGSDIVDNLYEAFNSLGINYALRIKDNLKNRISVIERLEKLIEDEEKEVEFEKLLFDHPWIIEPYWDSANIGKEKQKNLKRITQADSGKKETGIIDILLKVSEEPLPIIVELKREKSTSYSNVKIDKIIYQVTKYRRQLRDDQNFNATKTDDLLDFKAYFICNKKSLDKLSNVEYKELMNNKIKCVSYNQLIEVAKDTYHKDVLDEN